MSESGKWNGAPSARIRYTNHRGETSIRNVIPQDIRYGANGWHPEPQWFLVAYDLDRKAMRYFAMRSIHEWIMDSQARSQD